MRRPAGNQTNFRAALQNCCPYSNKAWLQAVASLQKSEPHRLDAGAENGLNTRILCRSTSPNPCGHELPAVSACLAQCLYRVRLRRLGVYNNYATGFSVCCSRLCKDSCNNAPLLRQVTTIA